MIAMAFYTGMRKGELFGLTWACVRFDLGRIEVQTDTGDLRLVLTAAGCPSHLERPWHAMRHTFATMFCKAGGSPDALSRILGHTGGGGNAITAGYVHVSMDYLARELARLSLRPSAATNIIPLHPYRHTAYFSAPLAARSGPNMDQTADAKRHPRRETRVPKMGGP